MSFSNFAVVTAKPVLEAYSDGYFKKGQFVRNQGMHWVLAGLFCVGDMAGAGIVALPTAMIQSQFWPGLIICGLMALVALASSVFLGRCWTILIRRWPEYRTHCRKPYAEIGFRALGRPAKIAVSVCINTTLFGATVVFLLLSAKNIHDFMDAFFAKSISFCFLIIVVAVALLPVVMLKSPQDFWWAIVAGMASTAVATVLLSIGAALDYSDCAPSRHMPDFTLLNYFLALGTFLFTFGGLAAFPTIQHDMKKPHEFTKSAILAFAVICAFYIPVVTTGYLSYGDSIRESIINSIQTKWIQQAVNVMITLHCLLTITLLVNPLNQEIEEVLDAPQTFGWKRFVIRSCVMLCAVIVAESVPNFGPLLNLVGGSTATQCSLIFPTVFYLYLNAADQEFKY
ncbi:Protein Y32F6A.4 [Aphelenchoides avenae]|nr:Protein Y32F6A.4 [Aphelenchus avenae]